MRAPMTLVIALAASKGGPGKNALAASLAVQAMKEGARVALTDDDPEAFFAQFAPLCERVSIPGGFTHCALMQSTQSVR